MKLKIFLVLAALGFGGASAQTTETVMVTARGLAGYWALTGPNLIRFQVGPLSGVHIIYSGDTNVRDICLLQRAASGWQTTCAAGASSSGVGGIRQDHITLRWWKGPATLIFDGMWNGDTSIHGTYSGGLAGVRVTGRIPARLDKIAASAAPGPNHAAVLAVWHDLAVGRFTSSLYDPEGLKRARRVHISPAGAPSVAYLGEIHIHWQQAQPNLLESVYAVRTPGDLALCRIATDARALVQDFDCQQAPSARD